MPAARPGRHMSDPTAGIRTVISRLRPFERLDTGRRGLALTTLAHLAQQVGQADAWRAIRDRVAHGEATDIWRRSRRSWRAASPRSTMSSPVG